MGDEFSRGYPRLGWVRVFVVALVSGSAIASTVGLALALDFYGDKANAFSSLSYDARQFGEWRGVPTAIRDRDVVEVADASMPVDAKYRIVIGPRWTPEWRSNVSSSVETDLLHFYLLPRELLQSGNARWVFCFACEVRSLGDHVRVVAKGPSGLRFVEVSP